MASASQPCAACGLPTPVGAVVGTVLTQRPLCGKPCAFVRIGVDINDLETAQRGFDEANAERLALYNEITSVTAELAEATRVAALRRGVVLSQNARYKEWISQQFSELRVYDDAARRLAERLAALQARESEVEQRMQALSLEMDKIRRLLERAARDDEADEAARPARLRYAEPESAKPEPMHPLMHMMSHDESVAPPQPRRGIFRQLWGESDLVAPAGRTPTYMEV